jgi:uncharacterized membrane protein
MLAFCNSYSEDIWVAYMFWSPDTCGGEGQAWQTIGWYHVSPGQCVTVYENSLGDVDNRYWYFYAKNADATFVWSGPVNVYVSHQAFNHCLGIGTSAEFIVGFQLLDVGDNDNFTMTLTG